MRTVHQRDFQLQFGAHLEDEYTVPSYGERERFVVAVVNVGWDTPPTPGDGVTLTVEPPGLGPVLDITETYATQQRFSFSAYVRLPAGNGVIGKVTFTGAQPSAYWSIVELG